MNRWAKSAIPVVLLLLLLGGIGYVITRNHLLAAIAAEKAEARQELADLRKQNQALQSTSHRDADATPESPAAPSPTTEEASLARARQTIELMQSGLLGQLSWPAMFATVPNLNLANFAGSGPLTIETSMTNLAGLLALSDAETKALLNAVSDGVGAYNEAIKAAARIRTEGGQLIIEISDPSTAKAAYDRMQDSIANVLGPERSGFYDGLGAKSAIQEAFNRWGMDGKSLVVWRGNDPSGRPLIMFSRVNPLAQVSADGGRGGGGAGGPDRETLKVNVGPLESLVPADF